MKKHSVKAGVVCENSRRANQMRSKKLFMTLIVALIGTGGLVYAFQNSPLVFAILKIPVEAYENIANTVKPEQPGLPAPRGDKPVTGEVVENADREQASSASRSESVSKNAAWGISDSLAAILLANAPEMTVRPSKNGQAVITNPSSVLVLVNKERNLPPTYKPDDLVVPEVRFTFSEDHPKKQLREKAARALEALFASAEADDIDIKAVSGYRSYTTQNAIFRRAAELEGEDEANKLSAYPGQSEHQTGLAMDVSAGSVGYGLVPELGETKEGEWLSEHAAEFGFILRYPKEQETATGYSYEPWHLRYVGEEAAKIISANELTLERFLNISQ